MKHAAFICLSTVLPVFGSELFHGQMFLNLRGFSEGTFSIFKTPPPLQQIALAETESWKHLCR